MPEKLKRSKLWPMLSVLVAIMLISLGFLLGPWTTSSVIVYIVLWLVFGGALIFIMFPTRGVVYLRISACVIGVMMTLSMIDFVLAQYNGGSSPWQLRSPVTGFFIVAIPAFAFTVWGEKSRIGKRLLEHGRDQQEHPESDESL